MIGRLNGCRDIPIKCQLGRPDPYDDNIDAIMKHGGSIGDMIEMGGLDVVYGMREAYRVYSDKMRYITQWIKQDTIGPGFRRLPGAIVNEANARKVSFMANLNNNTQSGLYRAEHDETLLQVVGAFQDAGWRLDQKNGRWKLIK